MTLATYGSTSYVCISSWTQGEPSFSISFEMQL